MPGGIGGGTPIHIGGRIGNTEGGGGTKGNGIIGVGGTMAGGAAGNGTSLLGITGGIGIALMMGGGTAFADDGALSPRIFRSHSRTSSAGTPSIPKISMSV
jgi:hypothetical protein